MPTALRGLGCELAGSSAVEHVPPPAGESQPHLVPRGSHGAAEGAPAQRCLSENQASVKAHALLSSESEPKEGFTPGNSGSRSQLEEVLQTSRQRYGVRRGCARSSFWRLMLVSRKSASCLPQ